MSCSETSVAPGPSGEALLWNSCVQGEALDSRSGVPRRYLDVAFAVLRSVCTVCWVLRKGGPAVEPGRAPPGWLVRGFPGEDSVWSATPGSRLVEVLGPCLSPVGRDTRH